APVSNACVLYRGRLFWRLPSRPRRRARSGSKPRQTNPGAAGARVDRADAANGRQRYLRADARVARDAVHGTSSKRAAGLRPDASLVSLSPATLLCLFADSASDTLSRWGPAARTAKGFRICDEQPSWTDPHGSDHFGDASSD